MSNFISRELAIGQAQVPSYTPYIVAAVFATLARSGCGSFAGYRKMAA